MCRSPRGGVAGGSARIRPHKARAEIVRRIPVSRLRRITKRRWHRFECKSELCGHIFDVGAGSTKFGCAVLTTFGRACVDSEAGFKHIRLHEFGLGGSGGVGSKNPKEG